MNVNPSLTKKLSLDLIVFPHIIVLWYNFGLGGGDGIWAEEGEGEGLGFKLWNAKDVKNGTYCCCSVLEIKYT